MPTIGELINADKKVLQGTSIARIAKEIQEKTKISGFKKNVCIGIRNAHNVLDKMNSLSSTNVLAEENLQLRRERVERLLYFVVCAVHNGELSIAFDLLVKYGLFGKNWSMPGTSQEQKTMYFILTCSDSPYPEKENLLLRYPKWRVVTEQDFELCIKQACDIASEFERK